MYSWLQGYFNKTIEIRPTTRTTKKKVPLNELIRQLPPALTSDFEINSKTLVSSNEEDGRFFRGMEKAGVLLNKSQLEAVRAPLGANCILAPAGSGKTTTILARIAYLIAAKGVEPKQILAVTFTRKAADEMKDRLKNMQIITHKQAGMVVITTMHSFFYRMLGWAGYKINLITGERHRIMITTILKDLGLRGRISYDDAATAITCWKNNLLVSNDINKDDPNFELVEVYRRYENEKSINSLMDFDDLILEFNQVIKENEAVRRACQKRFKHILVDEMQDTNKGQWEIMRIIAEPENNIFVVGDEDQAIYSFRGASPQVLLSFPKLYSSSQVYQLDINYRSCPKIIGFSSAIISQNKARFEKKVRATGLINGSGPRLISVDDEQMESLYVAGRIKTLVSEGKFSFRDFAVLFRVNSYIRSTFEALIDQKVPFVIEQEGDGFYERVMVKGVLSYLRLALDPNDFKSFSNAAPSLYISKDRENWIDTSVRTGMYANILETLKNISDLPNFQRNSLFEKLEIIKKLKHQNAHEAVKMVRDAGGYDAFILKGNNIYQTKHDVVLEDLEELEAAAKKYETVQEFIKHVDEINKVHEEQKALAKEPDADVVRLLSIHKSKGMEFPYVFIIGAIEGVIPHSKSLTEEAIEEERRLMYVAASRSQKELEIIVPKVRWDKKVKVSRLLSDLK